MPRPDSLPALLATAVARRYLSPEVAATVAVEARAANRPVERFLLERGLLSKRRVERLVLHVRYRSLRKADKAYARAALRARLATPAQLDEGLERQRAIFEQDREVVRLGSILVDGGVLGPEQDRALRAKLSNLASATAQEDSGSAATLMDDSASRAPAPPPMTSYRRLDAAIDRVENVRKITEELSTSEQTDAPFEEAGPDSAAEFENACRMLARRRVESATGSVSSSGKSTPHASSKPSTPGARAKASRGPVRLGA